MSKGPSIKIDEEDLAHIQKNIAQALIRVKQGIINPSFMISIIPTSEEDVKIKNKIEMKDARAIVTGREEVRTLADKMSIKNNLQLE
jgi:hypothetical protein